MRILFDTNAYVAWKTGHEGVARLLRESERVYASSVVVGELLAGFRLGTRYKQNTRELGELLADPAVVPVGIDNTTADRYARLVVQLRRKGRPIPTNDIWIAAQALQTGADLVSFDAHFGEVDGVAWVDPS